MRISLRAALAAALLQCCVPMGAAAPTEVAQQDFTQLSLQELLDVQVTSVSKHAEPLRHASAAVSVITGEDMRRTGARTIAQALRLVPGLQVYRTNAFNYTVTSRGFSGDKLEVLMDGRSVYSPLTSTVFWDVLDTSLNDVDRIEVIRGPGGTLWGANAVNGVINIVTRHSRDTVGIALRAGAGDEERAYGAFRTGAAVADNGHARFFAKAVERDRSVQRTGEESFDAQRLALGGFRTDWAISKVHAFNMSGGIYEGEEMSEALGATFARAGDTEVSGSHLLARWTAALSKDSEFSLQAYYDGYRRDIPDVFEEKRDTGDVQAQHRFQWDPLRTTISYGAGYRASKDDTGGPPRALIFAPASRTLETANAFVQGQRRLFENGELTVGTKLERNESTGDEWQPGIRLGWTLGQQFFTWGSVARAVGLPNRLDEDVALFCQPPLDTLFGCTPGSTLRLGSRAIDAENVVAWEWGLRGWTGEALSFDLTTFYNRYTDLRTTETNPPPLGSFDNKLDADSVGAELAVTWSPLDNLRVRPFYAFLDIDADPHADSTDAYTAANIEGGSPRHSGGLHLSITPWPNITVDGFLRHVGRIERQQVPAYTDLNFRIGWRPIPSLELALVGSDLLDDSHAEAGTAPSSTNPSPGPPAFELERAVWIDARWLWQ